MLQLIGTCGRIERETVIPTNGNDPFESVTLHIVSPEGNTDYVRVGRVFPDSELPDVGQQVVLGVWPRPYMQKATGELRCGYTAFSRVRTPVPA